MNTPHTGMKAAKAMKDTNLMTMKPMTILITMTTTAMQARMKRPPRLKKHTMPMSLFLNRLSPSDSA